MTAKKQTVVKVVFRQAGAIACGDYIAGKIYEVTSSEAKRLVDVKGFELVNDEDKH